MLIENVGPKIEAREIAAPLAPEHGEVVEVLQLPQVQERGDLDHSHRSRAHTGLRVPGKTGITSSSRP